MTREFIYDFIEQHGVMEKVKQTRQSRPPVPSQRAPAPPPPPPPPSHRSTQPSPRLPARTGSQNGPRDLPTRVPPRPPPQPPPPPSAPSPGNRIVHYNTS